MSERPTVHAPGSSPRPPRLRRAAPAGARVLRYGVTPCSLGLLLVAASREGISAIHLGDGHESLLTSLRRDFPTAWLDPVSPAGLSCLPEVLDLVEGRGGDLRLDLDPVGTPFQLCVWQALSDLSPGETIAYGALAARLHRPGAARAVAAACAANRLAVAVPCHRVLGADGGLIGYRWGVERKRQLLERERHAAVAGWSGC